MGLDVTPPLFVFADELLSFDSIDALLRYIEPVDAEDVSAVYDARGRLLALKSEGMVRAKWTVGGGRVWLEVISAEFDVSTLDDELRAYAIRTGPERIGIATDSIESVSHAELVQTVARFTHTA